MSASLSTRAHRYFAGTVAGLALATAVNTNVQAQHAVPDKLPDACMKTNETSRRAFPYDAALAASYENLTQYSGWKDLEASLKKAGLGVEVLCARTDIPAVSYYDSDNKVLLVGIPPNRESPYGPIATAPDDLVKAIKNEDFGHTFLAVTFLRASSVGTERVPYLQDAHDLESRIILRSALQAAVTAETALYAIDAEVNFNRTKAMDGVYKFESLSSEISDLHAKAKSLKAQGKQLSEADKKGFREAVLQNIMRDPDVRANWSAQYANEVGKRFQMGHNLGAFMYRAVPEAELTEVMSALPGNPGASSAVKEYRSYWKSQGAKDPAAAASAFIEKAKKDYANGARPQAQQQQGLPPGVILLQPPGQ